MFASIAYVTLTDGTILYKEVGTDRIVGDGAIADLSRTPVAMFQRLLVLQAPEMYPVNAYKFI